jgi:hypothetical protein
MARCRDFGAFAKRVAVGAAFLIVAAAPAQSAWAGGGGPLTGLYEGKATCSGLENGTPTKRKIESTPKSPALVTHGGTNAVLEFPGLIPFFVFVENNTEKQGQSLVSGITCTLDVGLSGATIFMTAKVKGDKVTLKGTLVILDDAGNRSESCKISLKRFDTSDANAACPL